MRSVKEFILGLIALLFLATLSYGVCSVLEYFVDLNADNIAHKIIVGCAALIVPIALFYLIKMTGEEVVKYIEKSKKVK